MNRVIFLVDGFNLYHSVIQAEEDNGGHCVKWLDLRRLCSAYLHMVRRQTESKVNLESIHYFSAPPSHRSKGKRSRHALYMRCLRSSGIRVHLGRFKRKTVKCSLCHRDDIRHEEKETDVAMGSQLFEVCHTNAAESVVIVTGDTDLAPAVRTCRRLFPDILICFAFPYKRQNAELEALAPESFKIKCRTYLSHQFPDELEFPDGTKVTKPPEW